MSRRDREFAEVVANRFDYNFDSDGLSVKSPQKDGPELSMDELDIQIAEATIVEAKKINDVQTIAAGTAPSSILRLQSLLTSPCFSSGKANR